MSLVFSSDAHCRTLGRPVILVDFHLAGLLTSVFLYILYGRWTTLTRSELWPRNARYCHFYSCCKQLVLLNCGWWAVSSFLAVRIYWLVIFVGNFTPSKPIQKEGAFSFLIFFLKLFCSFDYGNIWADSYFYAWMSGEGLMAFVDVH